MKSLTILLKLLVFGCAVVYSTEIENSSSSASSSFPQPTAEALRKKSQEKRAVGYSNLGTYQSNPALLGGYNSGIAGYQSGYSSPYQNSQNGYYNPYNTRVAGLGDLTNGYSGYSGIPAYNGYNVGYNGIGSSYTAGGYGYGNNGIDYNSQIAYPYTRPRYYSSYPSSYYNSAYGSSIVGGGLGALSPAINAGYNYGPGISGSVY